MWAEALIPRGRLAARRHRPICERSLSHLRLVASTPGMKRWHVEVGREINVVPREEEENCTFMFTPFLVAHARLLLRAQFVRGASALTHINLDG